jgi:hypothetical protein
MCNGPLADEAAIVAGDWLMSDEDGWCARFGETKMRCSGRNGCVPQGLDHAVVGRQDEERRQRRRRELRNRRERARIVSRICLVGIAGGMTVGTERDFLKPSHRADHERDAVTGVRGLRHPSRRDERTQHERREQHHGQTVGEIRGFMRAGAKRHAVIFCRITALRSMRHQGRLRPDATSDRGDQRRVRCGPASFRWEARLRDTCRRASRP